ncbi:MAG: glycoside hydrolase family 97 protein [Ignavibacteriaceae bacterium]|nr:glycoside hydrolase family 97 protein [Ignavibacteriaceae bacterium]
MNKVFTLILAFCINLIAQQNYSLFSPDKKIEIKISTDEDVKYSLVKNGKVLIVPSPLSMLINNKTALGINSKAIKTETNSVNTTVSRVIWQKSKIVKENYNELKITFEGNYALTFRAFNEGVAYRFETTMDADIKINSEKFLVSFGGTYSVYFPEEGSFMSHNEQNYKYLQIDSINNKRFCSLPAVVDTKEGTLIGITESDLEDYAGLWLRGTLANSLEGIFPNYVIEENAKNDRDIEPIKRADYIAITKGTRTFPWRIFAITENDGDLITNDLVYLLSKPCQIKDVSWIKPGNVAWDWWNALNIYNVDFRAGVNNNTYKYYIDFASKYGIDYVILDEGWYKLGDVLSQVPEINVPELVEYGKQKGVGIILWVIWKSFDEKLDEALKLYSSWGVKGLKIDFMQRDDQAIVNYYWKTARKAAEYKMLVDYHGAYKPSGLNRTYPNVLTSEGVKGLEHCKWSSDITPEHCVTLPFIRMFAGPMDFTPGAMNNVQVSSFKPMFQQPVSMGTRCQQLAMYVVYESPLQMLADNPTNYYREPECMEFLSQVPSVWEETKVLDAKIADYVLLARKSGDTWFVGGMTDATARQLTIDFSFLDNKNYTAQIWQDGINADRNGNDFKMITKEVNKNTKLEISLAPGGGWVARVFPK